MTVAFAFVISVWGEPIQKLIFMSSINKTHGSHAVCGNMEEAPVHPGLGVGPRDGRSGGATQAGVRGQLSS